MLPMTNVHFSQLPIAVRVMTCLSMFMAWVIVAEFVIDRYGFDRYIPFYQYANICPYDFLAAALVILFWISAHKRV
jgi:hypothetical protein